MDFTLEKYKIFLETLKKSGIAFSLRHDVDLHPERSLEVAKIEATAGVKSVYYFRAVKESWNESIMQEIVSLGHEIGYHYESLTTSKGNMADAYEDFCRNLDTLRKIAPVCKICMHGSPKSRWDSRDLWKVYDYRKLGLIFEPYFDTDFNNTLYLTDTGRQWDGYKVSVRDKIPGYQNKWTQQRLVFHSTDDIIRALEDKESPIHRSGYSLAITTHPQRWIPFGQAWVKEYISQSIKNAIKSFIVKSKTKA